MNTSEWDGSFLGVSSDDETQFEPASCDSSVELSSPSETSVQGTFIREGFDRKNFPYYKRTTPYYGGDLWIYNLSKMYWCLGTTRFSNNNGLISYTKDDATNAVDITSLWNRYQISTSEGPQCLTKEIGLNVEYLALLRPEKIEPEEMFSENDNEETKKNELLTENDYHKIFPPTTRCYEEGIERKYEMEELQRKWKSQEVEKTIRNNNSRDYKMWKRIPVQIRNSKLAELKRKFLWVKGYKKPHVRTSLIEQVDIALGRCRAKQHVRISDLDRMRQKKGMDGWFGVLNVSVLRFTHDTISPRFRNKQLITTLVEDLLTGRAKLGEINALEVVRYKKKWRCLSNRRLWALKECQKIVGEDLYVRVAKRPAGIKFFNSNSTQNDGRSVVIGTKH